MFSSGGSVVYGFISIGGLLCNVAGIIDIVAAGGR